FRQGHTERAATALAETVGEEGCGDREGHDGEVRDAGGDTVQTDLAGVDSRARKVPPCLNEYPARATNAAGKPFPVLVEMRRWRRAPSIS
ncbi:hypothetical protein ACK11Z_15125, partial [Methanoculleus bourgensis]